MGLKPGLAIDLRTGWDLNDERHVAAMWRYLETVKPYLVMGSPECKGFFMLMAWNKDKPGYEETLADCPQHLKIMIEVYKWQHRHGRLFVHEHPWAASSWRAEDMRKLLNLPGVRVAYVDQCMYGQSVTVDGVTKFAKKPTGFATNSRHIAKQVGG